MLGRNTSASVAYGEYDVASYGNYRPLAVGVLLVEFYIGGLNSESSALRHCISRIGGEVHQNLFDLHWIHSYPPQPFARQIDEFNIFTDQTVKHLDDPTEHGIQLGDAQCLRLL